MLEKELKEEVSYYDNMTLKEVSYRDEKGKLSNNNYIDPGRVSYYPNGFLKSEEWFRNGELHRQPSKPAFIKYSSSTENYVVTEQIWINGIWIQ